MWDLARVADTDNELRLEISVVASASVWCFAQGGVIAQEVVCSAVAEHFLVVVETEHCSIQSL